MIGVGVLVLSPLGGSKSSFFSLLEMLSSCTRLICGNAELRIFNQKALACDQSPIHYSRHKNIRNKIKKSLWWVLRLYSDISVLAAVSIIVF